MDRTLTVAELAALVDVDEGRVRKELEYGVLDAKPAALRFVDAVFLRAAALLGFELKVDDRRELRALIGAAMAKTPRPTTVPWGAVLDVKLGEVIAEVEGRLARFEAWKERLTRDPNVLSGEEAFPGTRLSVRKIGKSLLDGVREGEIREDYPYLSSEDLEFAKRFVKAYPRIGRPREAPRR